MSAKLSTIISLSNQKLEGTGPLKGTTEVTNRMHEIKRSDNFFNVKDVKERKAKKSDNRMDKQK